MAYRTKIVYDVYKKGEFIGRGTKQELARKTGLAPGSIRQYASQERNRKWRVVKDEEARLDLETDREYIRALMVAHDYNIDDFASLLNITPASVISKAVGLTAFTREEIDVLEDLFFLAEGELIVR